MRELTAETRIRVRAPLPLSRKRELTGDTRIRLSQIVDLKDWALEFTQDEAAPEGTVHHWSDGDHIKKNGQWVPVANSKREVSRVLNSENKTSTEQTGEESSNITPATPADKKRLENYSCTVDVSKVDTKAIKPIVRTIRALIKEYKMRPLDHINTDSEKPNRWGYSDGEGITLNENFLNNPDHYYNRMVTRMKEGQKDYNDYKKNASKYELSEDREKLKYQLYLDTLRSNVLYKGKEIECLVMHEMAHVICQQKIQMFNYDKTPEAKRKGKLILNTYLNAKMTGDINKISYYARKNRKEFFAEAFVIYKYGKEKLPDYITQMIEEVIK